MVARSSLRLLAVSLVLASAGPAPAGTTCTTGTIAGFQAAAVCGNSTTVQFSWTQADLPGYELMQSVAYPDYCSVPSDVTQIPFHVADSTTGTQTTLTGLQPNAVFVFFVRYTSCSTYRSTFVVGDTYATGPAAPAASAAVTGSNQVTLSYNQPDAKTFKVMSIERSVNGGPFTTLVGDNNTSFKNYCPAGHTSTYVDGGLANGTYTYRVTNVGNSGNCYEPVVSPLTSVTLGCPSPSAPTLSGPRSGVSGKALAFSWTVPQGLGTGGFYILEFSNDGFKTVSGFKRVESMPGVPPSAVISTAVASVDTTLSFRVRAVNVCDSSPPSNVVDVRLLATPPTFVMKTAPPPLSVVAGGVPPSAVLTFKNVGGSSDVLSFTPSVFFSVSPGSVTVAPGGEATVTLRAISSAVASPGFYSGPLRAGWSSGSITTPVTLRVVPSGVSGAKARANVATVLFSAPAGSQPSPQNITITVSGGAPGVPVALVPSVGPGGAWLTISPEVGSNVPASGMVTLTLTVDRSRRSPEEGSGLFRTNLLLTPYGGDPRTDAAVVEVLDVDALAPTAAAGLRSGTPVGGGSIILATAVRQKSGIDASQVFTSDGWLRNLSSSPVSADIFCTANGVDGLNATNGLVKTAVTLPAFGLFRTSDLMRTLFGADGISANIEVRSPNIGALSFRSTTDSVKGGDPASRFGTEIPVVSFGSGVKLGDPELVVAGVDSDDRNRSNLILAETSGSPATVKVTVNGADGTPLRTLTDTVPALSKIQIDNGRLFPTKASGAWVGVSVTAGAGRIAPIATVIDNASGSFSAVLGQALGGGAAPAAGRTKPLAGVRRYMMPTAVRTTGQLNTSYTTSMSMVNGTSTTANLTFTYRYSDLDDGGTVKTVVKTRAIAPRASFPKDIGTDVLASFFGVTHRSFGSIYVDGDVTKVTGVVAVSTQVDPSDPSKGVKTSQVPGVFLDSPSTIPFGAPEHHFSGLEKSTQKRSNLVLIEVDGQPASVTVRLRSASGDDLGTRTFSVGPNEYKQINDIFGSDGVNAGNGPFQNVDVSAEIAASLTGRVLALATVIDNVSFNPEVFILTPPAPPPDPTIGF